MSSENTQPELHLPIFSERIQRLCSEGQGATALKEVERALELIPLDPQIHAIHANALRITGNFGLAAAAWVEAAKLAPNNSAIWFGMGICLEHAGEKKGAFQAYAKAVEVEPKNETAFFKTIEQLLIARFYSKAIERLDIADDSIKQYSHWFFLRGAAAFEMGDFQSIQKPPTSLSDCFKKHPHIASLKLRAMTYDPNIDSLKLLQAAKNWDRWHGPKTVEKVELHAKDSAATLRIGFVNTCMRKHNIGVQQLALLKHRPPEKNYAIYLYSSNDVNDETTDQIAALADSHTDISNLDDEAAVQRIREDKIDILVDYNEFANNGRMGLFAHRAASIQVHYMGNALSTGLRAMDYRITDPVTEPEGIADDLSQESLVRLKDGYHFYVPPESHEKLRFETPALENGYVTFGGIHHLAKYNDEVLSTYKKILDSLPTARFIFARQTFEDPQTAQHFHNRIKQAGLPMNRIEIRPDRGTIGTLKVWNDIDCVLDTFPFGGDATGMDSCYAGVPIITLLGNRIAGRRSAALLHQMGHTELIATTVGAYVSLAFELGKDIARLNHYRKHLHETFKASPPCQHAQTAKAFFQALRQLWTQKLVAQAASITQRNR